MDGHAPIALHLYTCRYSSSLSPYFQLMDTSSCHFLLHHLPARWPYHVQDEISIDAENSHCGYSFLGVVETLAGHAHFFIRRRRLITNIQSVIIEKYPHRYISLYFDQNPATYLLRFSIREYLGTIAQSTM